MTNAATVKVQQAKLTEMRAWLTSARRVFMNERTQEAADIATSLAKSVADLEEWLATVTP